MTISAHLRLSGLILVLSTILFSCSDRPSSEVRKNAEQYYRQVAGISFEVNQQCYAMLDVFNEATEMGSNEREEGLKRCRREMAELSRLTKLAIDSLEDMPEFDSEVRLRESQLERLKLLHRISGKEFSRFMVLLAEPDNDAEMIRQQVMGLLLSFMEDMIDIETASVQTYRQFAEKYKVKQVADQKINLLHAGRRLQHNQFVTDK